MNDLGSLKLETTVGKESGACRKQNSKTEVKILCQWPFKYHPKLNFFFIKSHSKNAKKFELFGHQRSNVTPDIFKLAMTQNFLLKAIKDLCDAV